MLKVIGAGFGRTGTLSLKNALEQIGYGPCYHMVEVLKNPDHVALWQAIADGLEPDWDSIFANYASAVDWPTSAFYGPLLRAYPEAKVILTVRNTDAWHRSVVNTIGHPERVDQHPNPAFVSMVRSIVWDGIFDGQVEGKGHAVRTFDRHVAEVKATVPPERLLVFDAGQGWTPLCEFLDVPIPTDVPYPFLNTTEDWQRRS